LEVDYRGQHPQLEFRVEERLRSGASAITFEPRLLGRNGAKKCIL
jgi:hypothetical protein